MSLATLTKSGRAAIAKAIAARALHLAWGSGDPDWDASDISLPLLVDSTALVCELGRRTPTVIGFVTPDADGDIVIPQAAGADVSIQDARYRRVDQPTPYLYLRVDFAYEEASNAVIREMGVFMDSAFAPDLPPGQRYFTPVQVRDPGLLLAAQIVRPAINRNPSIRQTVEFVLPV